jgi:chromosome segregation ATPase
VAVKESQRFKKEAENTQRQVGEKSHRIAELEGQVSGLRGVVLDRDETVGEMAAELALCKKEIDQLKAEVLGYQGREEEMKS